MSFTSFRWPSVKLLEFCNLELSWSALIELLRDWARLTLSETLQDWNSTDNLAQYVSVSLSFNSFSPAQSHWLTQLHIHSGCIHLISPMPLWYHVLPLSMKWSDLELDFCLCAQTISSSFNINEMNPLFCYLCYSKL